MAGGPGIYSIGAVSRMLGLSQSAIRSWEDRYRLVVAERSELGRRLYTREQLDQLRFVKEHLDEGLSAADAHRLLAEQRSVGPEPGIRGGAEPGKPAGPAPDASRARGGLVLLAESDPYCAQLNELALRAEGFEVEIATSVAEAEEKFVSREPAVTVVELMISGGVGRELCRRLKQLRDAPLLCISSLDLREAALAAGADAFLGKPLDRARLAATVRELLSTERRINAQAAAAGDG